MNITNSQGQDTALSFRDLLVASGALVLPCLLPELNSILQLFMPAVAAAFLNRVSLRQGMTILLVIYILGSLIFFGTGMVASAVVLAQGSVICGCLLIAAWKTMDAPSTMVALTLSILFMSAMVMTAASGLHIQDVYAKLVAAMTAEYDRAVELYTKNAAEPLPQQVEQLVSSIRQTLVAYFPGIVCSFFVLLSLSNVLAFMKVNRIRGSIPTLFPDFDQWRMPWWLVWAFILFGFMALIPEGDWPSVGRNAVLVLCVFYLVQGFSVMRFFFKVMDTPVYIRYLVYALVGIQWYGLLLVVFTGLMDNWFDFRKRLERSMASRKDDLDL